MEMRPPQPSPSAKLAEPIGDSLRDVMTLMNKSGRFTPERQRELDELAAKQERQDRDIKARNMKLQNGVMPKYAIADLESVDVPQAKLNPDEFQKYLAARDQLKELVSIPATVIVRGDNGPGKTYLGCALVNAFCDQARSAYYCRAVDFFTAVKSTFGAPGKTLDELMRRFTWYELLVLDEIEVRSESVWENNLLRSLVDARYSSLRATVIVTNKTRDELRSYFSPAILSRISEGGAFVNCDWPSMR